MTLHIRHPTLDEIVREVLEEPRWKQKRSAPYIVIERRDGRTFRRVSTMLAFYLPELAAAVLTRWRSIRGLL